MYLKYLAASAASLVIAFSSTDADASTIRSDVNLPIGFSSSFFSSPGTLLDIDGDLAFDVRLRGSSSFSSRSSSSRLNATGIGGALVSSGPMLAQGDMVDGTATYVSDVMLLSRSSGSRVRCSLFGCYRSGYTNFGGAWSTGSAGRYEGFLGVQLTSGLFGWVQLDVNDSGNGRITAYGYTTQDGAAVSAGAITNIVAPAPVPLPASALMLGGALAGFSWMRRRARS